MIAPRVHLNGTSRASLLEAISSASKSVALAISTLRDTAPHARDYYVIGPDAYTQARDEYVARLKRLHDTNDELIAMYHAIEANEVNFQTTTEAR